MRRGRIRSRHQRPLGKRRRRELQVLAERDIMTTEQFKKWRAAEQALDETFMDAKHLLHCHCGANVKTTIVGACDLGWVVTSKSRQIVRASCPKCGGPDRLRLEKAIRQQGKLN